MILKYDVYYDNDDSDGAFDLNDDDDDDDD